MVCVRHLLIFVFFRLHGLVNDSSRLWGGHSKDGRLRYRALSHSRVVGFEIGDATLEVSKVFDACLEECQ
jgi:hypothetical protein